MRRATMITARPQAADGKTCLLPVLGRVSVSFLDGNTGAGTLDKRHLDSEGRLTQTHREPGTASK